MVTIPLREAEALSIALLGLDAYAVRFNVTADTGTSRFELIGFSEAQARETRVRVCAALQQIGVDVHGFSITVRSTPDNLPKSGAFDVPIALAVLGAIGQVPAEALKDIMLLGELALTGGVWPVRGVLPSLRAAVKEGITKAIVPRDNAHEAASVSGIHVFVATHLRDIVRHLREGVLLDDAGEPPPLRSEVAPTASDMSDIRGMHSARRAMEIAAAGGHNLLLIGPPGSGKTILARRLPSILPPLSRDEALEVTTVYSVAGLLSSDRDFMDARPFRAPHHTVSTAGLIGGGDPVRPGEITLAHHGVLFLDELFEFRGGVLEALRRPLEEGQVTIYRAQRWVSFPARALLVGATNPCPCGFLGDPLGCCTCPPERVKSYLERLEGPLFDHFGMRVVLPLLEVTAPEGAVRGESSSEIQSRVVAARALQAERQRDGAAARTNAELTPQELERFAAPDSAGAWVIAEAIERLRLSTRDRDRALRVARTIADMDGSHAVCALHVAEALRSTRLLSTVSTSS